VLPPSSIHLIRSAEIVSPILYVTLLIVFSTFEKSLASTSSKLLRINTVDKIAISKNKERSLGFSKLFF